MCVTTIMSATICTHVEKNHKEPNLPFVCETGGQKSLREEGCASNALQKQSYVSKQSWPSWVPKWCPSVGVVGCRSRMCRMYISIMFSSRSMCRESGTVCCSICLINMWSHVGSYGHSLCILRASSTPDATRAVVCSACGVSGCFLKGTWRGQGTVGVQAHGFTFSRRVPLIRGTRKCLLALAYCTSGLTYWGHYSIQRTIEIKKLPSYLVS